MIRIYYSYHRGGCRESVNTEGSHISLEQYSNGSHIESSIWAVDCLSSKTGGGCCWGPSSLGGVLWGPCIPMPKHAPQVFHSAHFKTSTFWLSQGLCKNSLSNTGLAKQVFLENYPTTHSGPSEMNEMKGRRLQPFFFSSKLLCRKNQQMDVLSKRNKS